MEGEAQRECLLALVAGDHRAFDTIYRDFNPPLFSFAVRLSGDTHLAEDLLQETWIRFANNVHKLIGHSNLKAWLFVVLRNAYFNHRRWRLLDAERIGDLMNMVWPRVEQPTPFELIAAREMEALTERSLAALPLRYREAALLVLVEGFTPQEAAVIAGISSAAMRQRLRRARARLREAVDAAEGGEVLS